MCDAFSLGTPPSIDSLMTLRQVAWSGLELPRRKRRFKASSNDEGEKQEAGDDKEVEFPQLPAIGGSSFKSEQSADVSEGTEVAFVGDWKFQLQYTCKVCETRNSHQVSRIAYRKGVVIAVCKGCMSKHLIADNLGWQIGFSSHEGETNIEEYFEMRGQEDNVNRVSPDVFELEKVMGLSSESGSLLGDGGEPELQ